MWVKANTDFWSMVLIGSLEECWPWLGCRRPDGYGLLYVEGRRIRAHRRAFILHNGKEPEKHVLHDCDNPPCCNPFHLFDGDDSNNLRQAYERGRKIDPQTIIRQWRKTAKGS